MARCVAGRTSCEQQPASNNKEAVMEHFTIVSMFHAASLQSIIMFVIIFPDKSVLFYTLE